MWGIQPVRMVGAMLLMRRRSVPALVALAHFLLWRWSNEGRHFAAGENASAMPAREALKNS